MRDRVQKRNVFLDSSQSTVLVWIHRGLSLTDACDGEMYTINLGTPSTGTLGVLVPLSEEQKIKKINRIKVLVKTTPYFRDYIIPTYVHLRIFYIL